MLHISPHPQLHLPPEEQATLPRFLLDPALQSDRAQQPILFPPPASTSVFSSRPSATPLSLRDSRDLAYAVARGLLAGKLNNGGHAFRKGDVVALYASNKHDYVPVVLGIHLAGGVAALCNPSYKAKELAHQLRMTGARAILTESIVALAPKDGDGHSDDTPFIRAKEAAKLAATESEEEEAGGIRELEAEPSVFVFEEDHPDSISLRLLTAGDDAAVEERSSSISGKDAAVYCFSSGTSGLPKAVILSHGNLVSNTIQASFMLYDRMNTAIDAGQRYSPDGKTGWYDSALPKGVGRESRPKMSAATNGSSGSKGGVSKLTSMLKRGLNLSKSRKNEAASIQDDGHQSGYEGGSGFERIESRPKGEQEFHIDVLPQFHCYGLVVNLVAIHTVTPRMILPRFHLETFLSSVQEHGITFGFVVPPILLALAKHPSVDEYDISTLWRVASGAASLPDEISAAVGARLGVICTDGYGMTEMSPIVALQTPLDVGKAPNTVGQLAPNTEALVLGADGSAVGTNAEGELLLRGPQMMQGYLHNKDATKNAFCELDSGRWLKTGDVVKIDDRGYIKITDRLKDVIKANGFQVSPTELEAVLFRDARVQDVAVIGTRDPKSGAERPWAFVVPRDMLPDEESKKNEVASAILAKANTQTAGYKKIAGLTWLDALPKSDAGKVLKRNLAVP